MPHTKLPEAADTNRLAGAAATGCALLLLVAWGAGHAPAGPVGSLAPSQSGQQEPYWMATGRVLNSLTRAPLPKATVRLSIEGPSSFSRPLTALTDDEGRFHFSSQQPGRFRFTAERTGFFKGEYGSPRTGRAGVVVPLDPPKTVSGLEILLTPPGSISGQVSDQDGEPLARMPVQVLAQHFRRGRRLWAPATVERTNERGEYRAYGLQPAKYIVLVQPLSPPPATVPASRNPEPQLAYGAQYYPNGTELAQAQIIDLPPGAELRGIDLSLKKTRVFRVQGTVELPAGWEGQRPYLLLASTVGTARISVPVREDGSFELRDLAPGTYSLAARAEAGTRTLAAQTTVTVTDRDIEGLPLQPTSGVTVTGRIRLPETAAPRRIDVTVQLTAAEGQILPGASARTDAEGTVTMTNVMPGRYRLETAASDKSVYLKAAALNGTDILDKGFDLASDSALALDFAADSATLKGEVRAKDAPVPGATVVLVPAGERKALPTYFRFASTAADGRFTIEGAVPGDYLALAFRDVDPNECYEPDFLNRHQTKATKLTLGAAANQTLQLQALDTPPPDL